MNPRPLKIAIAQIDTTIGDFEGTVAKVRDRILLARSQAAHVVAFPEMTTTGYPPRDLVESPDFIENNLKALHDIARDAKGIDVVVGYVERNTQSGGKPLFNAAALCRDGRVVNRYFKTLLPTYDVFDEGRYFEPGSKAGLWSLENASIGITVCEDAWNDKLFWEKRYYPRDPMEERIQGGAGVFLNLSASPFHLGKPLLRRDMMQALALKHGVPLVYVNAVGGNDELVFDGRSLVVNSGGEIVAEAKAYEEDFFVVDLANLRPLGGLREIDDCESVFQALVLGLRDYARKCGFKKVVLGLSGGIDSSLTAAIASEALGPSHVLGVAMPSPYSSEGSLRDARLLAVNLGIEYREQGISGIYEEYRRGFGRSGAPPDLADENVQARIRGNILMAISNREGHLVLSTGNKSELAVGYCTLYGDMSGGIALISDVPKTMVYELARLFQARKGGIPEEVFVKPPSAELRPNQADQDTLPPYEILDAILKAAVEENKSEEEILSLGFDPKTVSETLARLQKSEYKRRQAAPGIKVTSKAFGIGRRYPIARKI